MSELPDGAENMPKLRLDWTVPIWGVFGLTLQGVAFTWFLATLNSATIDNTVRIDKLEQRVVAVEKTSATVERLDERTKWIYDNVAYMRGQLDRKASQ